MTQFKKITIVIALVLSAFWGLWVVAIPEDLITHFIENSLIKSGIKIETEALKKGLFYNFGIKRINVTVSNSVPMLTINNVGARLNFTSVVKLTPRIYFNGNINDGKIHGSISLRSSDGVSIIKGSSIDINDIPALRRLGIKGKGDLAFDFRHINDRSEINFSLDDAKISSSFSGTGILPLEIFQKVRGALVIENELASVKSLVMEGKGIYARVKGDIRRDNQNLKIELMVDSSSSLNLSSLKIIEPFKVSPGYYVIPVPYFKISLK